VRLAILTMALGAFAIGLTEFAVTGLLPQIAADLAVSIPAAGNLVTAYAIGVVVGAPLLTADGRPAVAAHPPAGVHGPVRARQRARGRRAGLRHPRWSPGSVSGLPHGAFFGVAGLLAAQMGGARRASAVGRLFLGLTVANLVGVPAATVFGSAVGWRPAFALIAAIAAAVRRRDGRLRPPHHRTRRRGGLRAEFAAFALARGVSSRWPWWCSGAAASSPSPPTSPR
jgi:DHA1 family inner membrane transport protein